MSKDTGKENVKIVFCSYLQQQSIDLRQTQTKMIIGPLYTCVRIHFTGVNTMFVIFVCNYPGWPPGRLLTCFTLTCRSFCYIFNEKNEVSLSVAAVYVSLVVLVLVLVLVRKYLLPRQNHFLLQLTNSGICTL